MMNVESRRKRKIALAETISKMMFHYVGIGHPHLEDPLEDDIQQFMPFIISHTFRGKRYSPPRNRNYLSQIIPRFNATQFRMHFRITTEAFDRILGRLAPLITKDQHLVCRPSVDARQQLLSVLWLLATPDSYRSVGDRFGMGKSSLWDCFAKIITYLCNMASEVIHWPSRNELVHIANKYYKISRYRLKNVVGAIDGTYICIKAPEVNPEVYITRKCNYAITLQAVCNSNLEFIDCYTGWPGSVSDSRIFKNSIIYKNIMQNRPLYLPDDFYIVGDKAYPVLSWCIPPYIDRGVLTPREKIFNETVSMVRQTIERSFALLKGRFRRLKFLDMSRTDLIPTTILACCVLHNIAINFEDLPMRVEMFDRGVDVEQPENDELNYMDENIINEFDGSIVRDRLMMNMDLHD